MAIFRARRADEDKDRPTAYYQRDKDGPESVQMAG